MTRRAFYLSAMLALVLGLGLAIAPYGHAQEQVSTLPGRDSAMADQVPPAEQPAMEPEPNDGVLADRNDLVAEPRPAFVPDDPCLPRLYKNWYEFSVDARSDSPDLGFVAFRILLDRATFTLRFQGLHRGGAAETLYKSSCGIGELNSPTPEGRFIINHVYLYPDVAYFGSSGEPHRGLYNGFFAPVLMCDDSGLCQRFQELGIHGFNPAAYPDPAAIRPETRGAVSGGCVRLPDPCRFKTTLIQTVGIGPAKKNDRGVYHWLNRPVEVIISGEYPGTDEFGSVVALFEQGLIHVRDGLKNILGGFGP